MLIVPAAHSIDDLDAQAPAARFASERANRGFQRGLADRGHHGERNA
jgi:hypothetical protein